MTSLPILTAEQCRGRIRRLALQIWEANADATRLNIVGIAGQGAAIAADLADELRTRVPFTLGLGTVEMEKHQNRPPQTRLIGLEASELTDAPLVLVDDVLNTGRTLAFAFASLLAYAPSRVQVAVLVARHHALYPIAPDFVGHSLSTTLEEHIEVRMGEGAFLN